MGCLSLQEHWSYQLAGECLPPHPLSPLMSQGLALGTFLLQQPVQICGGLQMRAPTLLNPSTCSQKQNQCSKPLIPWGVEQEPPGGLKTCATQLLSSSISLLLSQECLQSPGPSAWYFMDTGGQALASSHCCKNKQRTEEGCRDRTRPLRLHHAAMSSITLLVLSRHQICCSPHHPTLQRKLVSLRGPTCKESHILMQEKVSEN